MRVPMLCLCLALAGCSTKELGPVGGPGGIRKDAQLPQLTPEAVALTKAKLIEKEKAEEAKAEFDQMTVLELGYDKVGVRDPKWDDKARKGLEAAVDVWSGRNRTQTRAREAYNLCHSALQAGCKDPLLTYACASMYDNARLENEQIPRKLKLQAATLAEGANYHPMRLAYIYARGADALARSKMQLPPEEAKRAQAFLDAAFENFSKGATESVPEMVLIEVSMALIWTSHQVKHERKSGIDRVFGILSKAVPNKLLPHLVKGSAYIEFAWDARGSGWANTVTNDGWRLMKERLVVAEETLTKAYEMDPSDPRAAIAMINVELGQGKGRDTMELWFNRAMTADPGSWDACLKKMYYLEPKWYGSEEDMLAFGRDLVLQGNWDAGLPFMLLEAHDCLSRYVANGNAYFKSPQVWQDACSVFDGHLKIMPDDYYRKSEWVVWAIRCGKPGEAKKLLDELGENVDMEAFGGKAQFEQMTANIK